MAKYSWGQQTIQTNTFGNTTANSVVSFGGANTANISNYVPFFTTYSGGLALGNISQLIVNSALQFDGANLTVGNFKISTTGAVSTTGNISAGYFVGNGALLTGISSSVDLTNVASNIIPATGNTYSLGNLSNPWQSLYVSANTIYIAGVPLSGTSNTLTFNGNNVVTANATGTSTTTGNMSVVGGISSTTLSATGNIAGSYIIGNGSQLTGLPASYSNANVTSYLQVLSTNISTSGNVIGGYIIGNGSQLTSITGNNVIGNVSYASIAGTVTTNAQPNITSTGTLTSLTSSGVISTTGNLVAGTHIIGDGSLITNITGENVTGNVGFANLAGVVTTNAQPNITSVGTLASLTSTGVISTTGNLVAGTFIIGNGSRLSNISGANVAGNVTSAITAGTVTTNAQPNITSTGILTSITSTGLISTSGTVVGDSIAGNGSRLSNITGANVTGTVANATYAESANIATTANSATTAGTVTTNAQPNITSTGTLESVTSTGLISTTGNVSANYIIGNGSQIANLPVQTGTYSNTNVASYLTVLNSDISTTGQIVSTRAGNLATGNGQLYINGTSTNRVDFGGAGIGAPSFATRSTGTKLVLYPSLTETATDYAIGIDPNVLWLSVPQSTTEQFFKWYGGETLLASLSGIGIMSVAGSITGAELLTGGNVSATGNVTGNYIIGDGSQLSDITGANVTGTVANATFAVSAGTAGTVTTNAQPNITSTGTLTSVTSTGLISTTGNITGDNILTAGQVSATGNLNGGALSVSGNAVIVGNLNVQGEVTFIGSNVITTNDLYIQLANNQSTYANINNAGLAVGPIGNVLTYWQYQNASNAWSTNVGISATANVTSGNFVTAGLVTATGNVTGNYIIGDGSLLTSLPVQSGTYSNTNVASYLTVLTSNVSTTGNVITGNVIAGNLYLPVGASTLYVSGYGENIGGMTLNSFGIWNQQDSNDQLYQLWTAGSGNGTVPGIGGGLYTGTYARGGIQLFSSAEIVFRTGATLHDKSYPTGGTNASNQNIIISSAGQLSIANTQTSTSTSTGAVVIASGGLGVAGNINAGGYISATGNVTGNYIIGDGSQLTNITGANVTGTVANATTANSATTAGTVTTNAQPNITSTGTLDSVTSTGLISTTGNIIGGNILTDGYVSATGNITGGNANIIGTTESTSKTTGALTVSGGAGIAGTLYTNRSVTQGAYGNIILSEFTGIFNQKDTGLAVIQNSSNSLSSGSGFLALGGTGTQIYSTGAMGIRVGATVRAAPDGPSGGSQVAVFDSTGLSVTGLVSTTGNITGGNILTGGYISATGNVTGNYIIGDGSQLTNITGANVTGTVANATFASSANTANTANTAESANTATTATTAGTVTTNAQPNITSTGTLTSITSTGLISTTGNITGNYIIGDGSQLTNITGANVTGTVANATFAESANTAGTVTTNAQPNITSTGTLTSLTSTGLISTTGNITGNYIIGDGSQLTNITATTAGTVTTNAQPNITSTGTLTSITSTGLISTTGNISGGNILTDGYVSATGNITGGNANITGTTASTSKTTGALTVAGGVGVAGTIYNNRAVTQGAFGNVILTEYTGIFNEKDSGAAIIQNSTNALSSGSGFLTYGDVSRGTEVYSTGAMGIRVGATVRAAPEPPTGGSQVAYFDSTGLFVTGLVSATGNVTGNYVIGNVLSTTVSASGNVTGNNANITGTTASTSKTTGALTVAGGAGVAGTLYNNRAVTQGPYGNVILTEYTGIFNEKDTGIAVIQNSTNALSSGIGFLTAGGTGTQIYSTGTIDIKVGVTAKAAPDAPSGGTVVASVTSTGLSVTGLISTTGNITGTASTGTLTSTANSLGYLGAPVNSQSGIYTLTISDQGATVYTTSDVTIPDNGNVAFPVGTRVDIIAQSSAINVAISTDTLYLGGTGTTGTRTLSAYAVATLVKVSSTVWYISGAGVS